MGGRNNSRADLEVKIIGLADRQFGEPVLLSTGYYAVLMPVAANLVTQAQMSVDFPDVPVKWIEEKGREEENPNDPKYLAQVQEAEALRLTAMLDAMIMFGVNITDEEGNRVLIDSGEWVEQLKMLSEFGYFKIDWDKYNLKNAKVVEFLFKKYVAIAAPDIQKITSVSALVSEEEIAKAIDNFRSNS